MSQLAQIELFSVIKIIGDDAVSFLQGQVETGEQATSPVVTTMANAARGADVLQITGLTGSFAMNLKYEDGHYEFVDQAASSNISPVLARYLQCFSLTPSP